MRATTLSLTLVLMMILSTGCDRRDLSAGVLRAADEVVDHTATDKSLEKRIEFSRIVKSESADPAVRQAGYGYLWKRIRALTKDDCMRRAGAFRDLALTMSNLVTLQMENGLPSADAMDLRIELLGWMKSRIRDLNPFDALSQGWSTEDERVRYERWTAVYVTWLEEYVMAVRMLERSLVEGHVMRFEWKTAADRALYAKKLAAFLGRPIRSPDSIRESRNEMNAYIGRVRRSVRENLRFERVLWP